MGWLACLVLCGAKMRKGFSKRVFFVKCFLDCEGVPNADFFLKDPKGDFHLLAGFAQKR